MNIYRIKYSNGYEKHIVAESYGEAEKLWKDYAGNDIDSITIISENVILSDKLKQ